MVSRIQGTQPPAPPPLHDDQFRLLFEAANDVIVIGAVDGTIVAVNPAGERLLGFSADEAVGRDAFDFVAPEWRGDRAGAPTGAEGEPGACASRRFWSTVPGPGFRSTSHPPC